MESPEIKNRLGMDARTRKTLRGGGVEAMQKINAKIRQILEKAPSDATAELEVGRDQDGFHGLLKIVSQQRKFVGGGRGKVFADVIDQIFAEVWKQISSWKKERDIEFEANEK